MRLGAHAKYRSAGTVEFLVDDDTGKFYFLEVPLRANCQLSAGCNITLAVRMLMFGTVAVGAYSIPKSSLHGMT